MQELFCPILNVNVLATGNGSGGSPPCGGQINCNGGSEITRIGEQGHRSLDQGLFRSVATQRTAKADMIPGISKTQAVAAKQVNAVNLTNGTHNTGIFDRHLLGQNDGFFQVRVFAHRFGDPILHAGGG